MDAIAPATPTSGLSVDEMLADLAAAGQKKPELAVQEKAPAQKTKYVEYKHETLADMRILNPMMSIQELARAFGRNPSSLSILMASDAFQEILERRRQFLEIPTLKEEVVARFREVTRLSLEKLQEKLELPSVVIDNALLLKAVELGAKGMGVGGFAPPAPPPPATPTSGRLTELAYRLEKLIPNHRADAIDVEVREVPKEAV